jgi:hypothetical protein
MQLTVWSGLKSQWMVPTKYSLVHTFISLVVFEQDIFGSVFGHGHIDQKEKMAAQRNDHFRLSTTKITA